MNQLAVFGMHNFSRFGYGDEPVLIQSTAG